MASPRPQHPFDRAVRLLAARARTTAEIRDRLERAGATADEIAATLERLSRAGYLDDRALAQTQAEGLLRDGRMSPRAAVLKLTARGIPPELAEQSVAALAPDEPSLARAALAKRFGATPLDPTNSARAARFLSSRGFPEDVIAQLLGPLPED
jgi:regulatory protein